MRLFRSKDDLTCIQALIESAIINGQENFCLVCNRCMYERNTKPFQCKKYNLNIPNLFTNVESSDGCEYICKTCDHHLSKGSILCQAVCITLEIDVLPDEICEIG